MVNPYRRGLGLGGRGEPMPYTGGGSARPLEPTRGGRGVQLEDDPYADPSRTPPTYGDDGSKQSTQYMSGGPAAGSEDGQKWRPSNRTRQANRYDREGVDDGAPQGGDDDWMGPADKLARAVNEAQTDEEVEAVFADWRRRMRAQGMDEREIRAVEAQIRENYADGLGDARNSPYEDDGFE